MFGNLHPLGFLDGEKAHDAQLLIGQTELLVSSLAPLQADLQPAAEALDAAKLFYAAQEYSRAVAQAIRAGALAVSLNERFNAYMAAWKDLQSCRDELLMIGFPTDMLEEALGAADKEVARRVEEEGTSVPNYLGAGALLERAIAEARALVGQAKGASREIFLATLAVEALSGSPTTPVASPLTLQLEEIVEQATRELAQGQLPAAFRLASEARSRAEAILAGASRVYETLDMAAAILGGLDATGPLAEGIVEKIAAAHDALDQKLLDKTMGLTVAEQISRDVAAFAKRYPPAHALLERAEGSYDELQKGGFRSDEVVSALASARRALGEGDWTGVSENVGRASQIFQQLQEEQARMARAIQELEERVGRLKVCRLRMLPEVEELLGHAREQADSFRLPASREVLLHAKEVLLQAMQGGS